MNSKRSKSYKAVIAGALQLTAGAVAIITYLSVFLFQSVVSFLFKTRTTPGPAQFLATDAICALFFYCAFRNFSFAGRCSKIQRRLNENRLQAPIPLSELADITRQPVDKVSMDIQIMIEKDYLAGPLQLDLFRQELVPGAVSPVKPPEPAFGDTFVYKEVTARSGFPFLVLLVVAASYILMFGFHEIADALYIAIVAGCAFFFSYKCTVPYKRVVQRAGMPRPPVKTGDKEADDALEAAIKQLEQMRGLSRGISNKKIDSGVQQLLTISQEIFDYVKSHPEKLRQTRQFMNYYLPTTIKLLDSYVQFSRHEVRGENVSQSLEKIESMIESIVQVFHKQLDNLYYDKAIDISTEIDVMKSMLEQEGIGG